MHLAKIRKKGRNVLKRVGSKIDGRLNCYMHYFKIESTFLGHLRGILRSCSMMSLVGPSVQQAIKEGGSAFKSGRLKFK